MIDGDILAVRDAELLFQEAIRRARRVQVVVDSRPDDLAGESFRLELEHLAFVLKRDCDAISDLVMYSA